MGYEVPVAIATGSGGKAVMKSTAAKSTSLRSQFMILNAGANRNKEVTREPVANCDRFRGQES